MKLSAKSWLLASASALAIASGSAYAADKAPAPFPGALWAGPYAGLNLGLARHDWAWFETGILFNGQSSPWVDSQTGFTFGGQLGYNWQRGSYVYGVEADLNWLGVNKSQIFSFLITDPDVITFTTSINWLATFRGRMGLAVDATLVYVTAGLAVANVRNGWTDTGYWDGIARSVGGSNTRLGWTAGVGVEHMFARNWTARLEARYTDLGRSSVDWTSGGTTYTTSFTNSLWEVRAGFNYKW